MKNVTIYTGPLCNFCDAAKKLLTRNNVEYKEINIATVDGAMDEMITKANGKRTIPQIFLMINTLVVTMMLEPLKKKINY
jgi:glutaredoxin 3